MIEQHWHEVNMRNLSSIPKDTPLFLQLDNGIVMVGQLTWVGNEEDGAGLMWCQSYYAPHWDGKKWESEAECDDDYHVTRWHPMPDPREKKDEIRRRPSASERVDGDDKILEACDGSCVTAKVWCPDCDCLQRHVRISEIDLECCECGDIHVEASENNQ